MTSVSDFRHEFEDLAAAQHETLYALPPDLLKAICKEVPRFFDAQEKSFEEALTALCYSEGGAVGIKRDAAVHSTLIQMPVTGLMTQAEIEQLGWNNELTLDQVNASIRSCEDLAEPFKRQMRAYAGWLMTNPQFLRELKAVGDEPATQAVFCARWRLLGMKTRELPDPCGGNFTGLALPGHLFGEHQLTVSISDTLRLPTRFPVHQIMEQMRERFGGDHLAQWRTIVTRSGAGRGVQWFDQMFRLHFHRNLSLLRRYPGRDKGNVEGLDYAFTRLLKRSIDEVKRLRRTIVSRLAEERQ